MELQVGVKVLLKNKEGKYLFLHRSAKKYPGVNRLWDFPGGRIDPGAPLRENMARELKEETGLDVENFLQEEPLPERYEFRRRGETVVKTVHYFPAIVSGEVRLQPEEIQDSKWVLLKEAVRHLTFRESKEMCRILVRQLNV